MKKNHRAAAAAVAATLMLGALSACGEQAAEDCEAEATTYTQALTAPDFAGKVGGGSGGSRGGSTGSKPNMNKPAAPKPQTPKGGSSSGGSSSGGTSGGKTKVDWEDCGEDN